jgi:hypothetical protein
LLIKITANYVEYKNKVGAIVTIASASQRGPATELSVIGKNRRRSWQSRTNLKTLIKPDRVAGGTSSVSSRDPYDEF